MHGVWDTSDWCPMVFMGAWKKVVMYTYTASIMRGNRDLDGLLVSDQTVGRGLVETVYVENIVYWRFGGRKEGGRRFLWNVGNLYKDKWRHTSEGSMPVLHSCLVRTSNLTYYKVRVSECLFWNRTRRNYELRALLFWDVTQRRLIVICWRFGLTHQPHHHGLINPRRMDFLPFEVVTNRSSRNVSDQYMLLSIPEEWKNPLHCGGRV